MVREKGDRATTDLFSWEPPVVAVGYAADVAGKGDLQNKIARLIGRALRDARDNGLTRQAISFAMSDELARSVSEDMLDKWASEASGQHRIPLDAFAALITVTGATDLLGFLPAMFGYAVVPKKFEAIIELQLLEEHERDIADRKARLQSKVRGRS